MKIVTRQETFTGSAISQVNSGLSSYNSSYASYCIGYTAENPYSSSSNLYSNSSGTAATIDYSFDLSSIISNATINSVSCVVNGHCESTSNDLEQFDIQLYCGDTAKGSVATLTDSTSNHNVTITNCGTWTRQELDSLILRNTVGYYGGLICGITLTIEWEGDETIYDITASVDLDATLNTTSEEISEGNSFTLEIYPNDNETSPISVTDNGTNVSVTRKLLGTEGSYSQACTNSTTSGLSSGESYALYAIGYTAENPNSQSGNYYSSRNSTGYAYYTFDLSSIPNDANIISVNCNVYGKAESSTQDSTHFSIIQLYADSTAKGNSYQFSNTSNTLVSLENCGTWTRSELDTLQLQHSVGYYGGGISGITLIIEWEVPREGYKYTYTISSVNDDHNIIVIYKDSITIKTKINGSWEEGLLKAKLNGEWKDAISIYKKENGSWTLLK